MSSTCYMLNLTHITLLVLLHYLVKVEAHKMHMITNSPFNVNDDI